jgi:hypothetical protein
VTTVLGHEAGGAVDLDGEQLTRGAVAVAFPADGDGVLASIHRLTAGGSRG